MICELLKKQNKLQMITANRVDGSVVMVSSAADDDERPHHGGDQDHFLQ